MLTHTHTHTHARTHLLASDGRAGGGEEAADGGGVAEACYKSLRSLRSCVSNVLPIGRSSREAARNCCAPLDSSGRLLEAAAHLETEEDAVVVCCTSGATARSH